MSLRGSSFLLSFFALVSVCVWEPNKLFDGNVGWVRKLKLEDGGGNGERGGKIWLVVGGGGGGSDSKLKEEDDGSGGGGGGRGKKGVGGGVGGGEVLFSLSFNLFNLFLMVKSTPGGPGAFFTRSPAISFLPPSSFLSKDPTSGFSTSKVDISSKGSSGGFCLLKIFFFIGSRFCIKLALLILSLVS